MAKLTISFSIDDQTDRDIVRWIQSLPKRERSASIRAAIRSHTDSRQDVTLGDVYQAIQNLKADIKTRSFTAQPNVLTDWPDEPAAAAAALDKLGTL